MKEIEDQTPPVKSPKKIGWLDKLKKILTIWLILQGLIFGVFIMEEATQTAGFAGFYSKEAGRPDLIRLSADIVEKVSTIGRITNYIVGWLNPIGFFAYNSYFSDAAPIQVESMRAMADSIDFATTLPESLSGNNTPTTAPKVERHKLTVMSIEKTARVAVITTAEGINLVCFPSSPVYAEVERLKGQTVVIEGAVEDYQGQPEIVINDWSQVE